MNRKYEMTQETKVLYDGTVLHRIKALRDFGPVKAGDLGGWIESERNLSHEGTCWVAGKARVYGKAQVLGEARVYGKAQVYDEAQVLGEARVYDEARVCGSAWVFGEAWVFCEAYIAGQAQVSRTKDCICITGFSYHITILPQHVHIGCQIKTAEEWLSLDDSYAKEHGVTQKEADMIKAFIKAYATNSGDAT